MKKSILIVGLILVHHLGFGQDTFSIVAVDPATGEVGSAGASCVDGAAAFGGIIDIISGIIPGKGGVNSQAYVCIPNGNLQNALDQMQAGDSPSEIIGYLLANDEFPCSSSFSDPSYRQYGIADLDDDNNPRTAGWSGANTDDYKDDIQEATFSVQGNILLNATVLENMRDNFNATTGTLADKLMAAMQGANFAGADSRCLDRGTSSTTAFLQVYRADDLPGSPYLRLNIEEMPFGEEPIDSLQSLYDQFLSVPDLQRLASMTISPNPVKDVTTLTYDPSIRIVDLKIYDINGRLMHSENSFVEGTSAHQIRVLDYKSGVYFLVLDTNFGAKTIQFIKQ
ncbi:MAG: DUF1028 domain-containing protein [Gilvibacter sp.]